VVNVKNIRVKSFNEYLMENSPIIRTELDKEIHSNTATSQLNDIPIPSMKDAKSGDYKKSRIKINGLIIDIENPYGSVRKGISSNGESWEITLSDNYGEIKGYDAADGDYLDIFIRPHMTQKQADNLNVIYVIDQLDPTTHGFDEHKVVFGYETIEESKRAYLANYKSNWTGLGYITPLTMTMFKYWIKNEDLTQPLVWGK